MFPMDIVQITSESIHSPLYKLENFCLETKLDKNAYCMSRLTRKTWQIYTFILSGWNVVFL